MGHRIGIVWGFILLALFTFAGSVEAEDARLGYLARMLRDSDQYRVRVQAAMSLGEIGSRSAAPALRDALRDEHPAVRTAAATALAKVGDATMVDALEALGRDSNAGVRSAVRRAIKKLRAVVVRPQPSEGGGGEVPIPRPSEPSKVYIGVGDMGNRSGVREKELKGLLKQYVRDALTRTGGVKLAPDGETPQAADRVIKRERLDGYFLTGSVLRMVEGAPGSISAEVSVMVLTNPGRDLRMMLNGSAQVSGGRGERARSEEEALQAAATGAVRRLASQLGLRAP